LVLDRGDADHVHSEDGDLTLAALPHKADWDDLRALLALAALGSMSKAGATLGESQPTIGRRIARLEQQLGVALVARSANAAVLTPAGREVARAARPMIVAAREAEAAARAARPRPDDPVRLTTTASIAAFLSRRWTALRAATHPRELLILPSRRLFDLATGEADMAIRLHKAGMGATQNDGALLVRKIGQAAFGLYALRGREDGPVLMAPAARATSKQLAMARRALEREPWRGVGPEIDEMHLRAEAILAGVGVGGLPCWLGDSDARLARIEGEGLGFCEDVFLARHARTRGDGAVERLAREVARLFRVERDALAGRS
jgi:DNA-binding transcriptional LysR family regulator